MHQENVHRQAAVEQVKLSSLDISPKPTACVLTHHLQTLRKQTESFSTCNELFNGLIVANGFAGGAYFAISLLSSQYNLELMAGSIGSIMNAMKLSGEHQNNITIQNTTARYLVETERVEEIIKKRLERTTKR
jgi:hypothetical protein